MTTKYTDKDLEKIVEWFIKNCKEHDETIEGELLRRKMIRELYRILGEPQATDFPLPFNHRTYWDRFPGYTTYIDVLADAEYLTYLNGTLPDYNIKKPSETKRAIINDYLKEGWHIRVHAMNVICDRYEKHPRFPNIYVRFYVTRDSNRYEYIIVEED